MSYTEAGDLSEISKISDSMSVTALVHFIAERGTRSYTVFEGDDNVVGYCLVRFEEDAIFVHDLRIASDYRRSGFGSRALEKLTGVMQTHGKKYLAAAVREDDSQSILFWNSFGAHSKLLKGHFKDVDGVKFTIEGGIELC